MNENLTELNFGVEISPEKNKVVGGTLYLVATPVGNLADHQPALGLHKKAVVSPL